MTTVHVLANPAARAGRAARRRDELLGALRAAGADCTELDASTRERARDSLRAVRGPGTRVVVCGGDGVVHLALDELACSGTEVGLLPVGTGNDFAHALGLDRGDLAAQAERALAPAVPLDAIRTTGGWVASVVTVGFSAAVNRRADAMRRPRGSARYTLATIAELGRLAAVPLTLELDGEATDITTTMLAIANTACFGGGMRICPDAVPDDGLLDVAVVGAVRADQLLRVFPRVFKGTHVTDPRCTMHRARQVRLLRTDTEVRGDGEPLGPAPFTCEAVPAALAWAGVDIGGRA